MRLFIAEKPSMAQAIANAIGGARKQRTHNVCEGGDVVTRCFGHLLEQAPPEAYDARAKAWTLETLPIIPGTWRKEIKPDAKTQFAAIRDLVSKASEVVNAGDPDREGNLLVDDVLEAAKNKVSVKRIWLLGLDQANVKRALASLKPNADCKGYTAAAEGRGRADWRIGMNLSRGFTLGWQRRSNAGTLHVGRVQTPTLGFVVARDREIANFKPVDYFNLKFNFEHTGGVFSALWQPRKDTPSLDAEGRIVDRSLVNDLVKTTTVGRVAKLDVKTGQKKSAPLPFSLSAMQKEANKRFGYAPDEVLEICQSLYEAHKVTTHPRSDCGYLPETQRLAPG